MKKITQKTPKSKPNRRHACPASDVLARIASILGMMDYRWARIEVHLSKLAERAP